jgi:hypothetical protein
MTNKTITKIGLIALFIPFLLGTEGCDESQKQVSSSGASQVRASHVKKNSKGRTVEQQNINDRIQVTTDPTKILWMHLIALDGKIIRRMPVVSKVSSSGKRLEAKHWVTNPNGGTSPPISGDNYTDELIQPDGTYGDSDAYIFWFDPQHRYHQYGTAGGLGYLLTDYPIDLVDPVDSITGMYNANLKASEWQKLQENKMKGDR